MKNNDDFLARQGDVYTLVDASGYLVREDISGERKRYALEGEGGGGTSIENYVEYFNGKTGSIDFPKYEEAQEFTLKNDTFIHVTNYTYDLNWTFNWDPANPVRNAFCRFSTPENFDSYTITFWHADLMVNKPIVLEPNKTYILGQDFNIIFFTELVYNE